MPVASTAAALHRGGGTERFSVPPSRKDQLTQGVWQKLANEQDWNELCNLTSSGPCQGPRPPNATQQRFRLFIGVAICANVMMMGLRVDRGRTVPYAVWYCLDIVFGIIWLVEMGVKLNEEQWRYFCSWWNLLDVVLVGVSVMDVVLGTLNMQVSARKDSELREMMKKLSLLRMLRLLRLVRLLRMFKRLWVIVSGFIVALPTLGWVVMLLSIIIYSGSVLLTIIVGQNCQTEYSHWKECNVYVGNVVSSMYSLFQALTLESWSMALARPMMKKQSWLVFFFVAFLFLTTFGMLNIIIGVLVDNTLRASKEQAEAEIQEQHTEARNCLRDLKEIFENADQDGSGILDKQEFVSIMQQRAVQDALRMIEVPYTNPGNLFELLDRDGSNTLTLKEFIDGSLRLKAAPTNGARRRSIMRLRKVEATLRDIKSSVGFLANWTGVKDTDRSCPKSERKDRLCAMKHWELPEEKPVPRQCSADMQGEVEAQMRVCSLCTEGTVQGIADDVGSLRSDDGAVVKVQGKVEFLPNSRPDCASNVSPSIDRESTMGSCQSLRAPLEHEAHQAEERVEEPENLDHEFTATSTSLSRESTRMKGPTDVHLGWLQLELMDRKLGERFDSLNQLTSCVLDTQSQLEHITNKLLWATAQRVPANNAASLNPMHD